MSNPAQKLPTHAADAGPIDVGLLLEGTYPYVSGGVSSWVHEIISGLPELTFGAIFLGASPETYGEIRYELPPNLVHLETHYLMSGPRPAALPRKTRTSNAGAAALANERAASAPAGGAMAEMVRLHDAFRARGDALDPKVLDAAGALGTPSGISLAEFQSSDETWTRLCAEYDAHCASSSFLDYFWTVRTMHRPLFTLAALARRAPEFRMLHAVSTGYAGFLGALLQRQRGCPFVVTEHGIYTKERKIDLARAAWIKDEAAASGGGLGQDLGYLRRLWIGFFEGLGRAAYATARPIISLYEGNRERQVEDGAARERTRVIPNGIDVARFARASRGPLSRRPCSGWSGASCRSRTSRPSCGRCARWWRRSPAHRAGSSGRTTRTRATPRSAARSRAAWGSRTRCASWASAPPKRCCPIWAWRC